MLIQPRTLVPFTFERRIFRRYLLRDDFTTAASAPVASPRPCEPGPGTLTLVQTDGQMSISADKLQYPAQASPAWGDQGAYSAAGFARQAGRALLTAHRYSALGSGLNPAMWLTGAALNTNSTNSQAVGLGIDANNHYAQPLNALVIGAGAVTSVDYQYALVLRAQGAFYLIKGGAYSNWTLLFADPNGTQTPLYPGYSNYNAAGSLDHLRVIDLYAPFDTDYGIATLHTAAVSGSDYAATASLIADLVITAPSVLANSAGLKFRKSGGDYWQVHLDSSGSLILQRYAANVAQGSPVTLATSVISGSAARTVRVIADGSSMNFYTLAGSSWTKRGSTQTDSVLTANTGLSPFADAGWVSGGGSVGQLDSYARTSSIYNVLDSI